MNDGGEGTISFAVPGPPGGGEEGLGRRAQGADSGRGFQPELASPWGEDAAVACPAAGTGIAARAKGAGRRTAVTYVINEASQGPLLAAESGALQSLREACEVVGATLETLHFGKLDFGETAVLDRFYNAGETAPPRPSCWRLSPSRFPGRARSSGRAEARPRAALRREAQSGRAAPAAVPSLCAAAPGWAAPCERPRLSRREAKVCQILFLSPADPVKRGSCQRAHCERAAVGAADTGGLCQWVRDELHRSGVPGCTFLLKRYG